jgi:hypothetical protein
MILSITVTPFFPMKRRIAREEAMDRPARAREKAAAPRR